MFKHILVAVDGSECASDALTIAIEIAVARQAMLSILYVVDPLKAIPPVVDMYGSPPEFTEELTKDGFAILKTCGGRAAAAGAQFETSLLDGPPVATIVNYAREKKVDLIVLGSHGRKGLSRVLLGSVAEGVMRDAKCPTLIVHHAAGVAKTT